MDRSWAVDLSEQDFVVEYQRRFGPHVDVIPTQAEYVKGSEPVYHGIDGVNPEDMAIVDEFKPEPPAKHITMTYSCRYCNKEFTHRIAQAGHEKTCKG